jgi:NAD(P)H-nitrite reductase large subunit
MKHFDFSDLQFAHPERIICYCKQVSQGEIESAIKLGAKTFTDIQRRTNACTGNQCKELNPRGVCCSGDIRQILNNSGLELNKIKI